MVRKNTSLGTGLTILALLCLFVVMVVTLWPQYRPTYCGKEGFEVDSNFVNPSSYSLYTKDTTTSAVEFDRQFNIYKNTMNDADTFYQFKRCYQFADAKGGVQNYTMDNLKDRMSNISTTFNIKIDFINPSTADFNTGVIQEVKSKVESFAGDNQLQGPIYMLVTQAPFWRNSEGKLITNTSFQSDAKQNNDPLGSKPYFPFHQENSDKSVTEQGPVLYYVWIIYDRYTASSTSSNKILKGSTDPYTFTSKVMSEWDVKYFSKLPQCFMAGAGTTVGINMFAGAGSKITNLQPVSTVTGPKQALVTYPDKPDPTDQHTTQTTFAVLYNLNTPGLTPMIVNSEIDCRLYETVPSLTAVPYKCTAAYWSTKCHNPDYINPADTSNIWSTASYYTIKTNIDSIAKSSDVTRMQSCYGSLSDYVGQYIKDNTQAPNYYYVSKNNSNGVAVMNKILTTSPNPPIPEPIKAKAFLVPNAPAFFKVVPNDIKFSDIPQ